MYNWRAHTSFSTHPTGRCSLSDFQVLNACQTTIQMTQTELQRFQIQSGGTVWYRSTSELLWIWIRSISSVDTTTTLTTNLIFQMEYFLSKPTKFKSSHVNFTLTKKHVVDCCHVGSIHHNITTPRTRLLG